MSSSNECVSGLLDDISMENHFSDVDFSYSSNMTFDMHPICGEDFVSYRILSKHTYEFIEPIFMSYFITALFFLFLVQLSKVKEKYKSV